MFIAFEFEVWKNFGIVRKNSKDINSSLMVTDGDWAKVPRKKPKANIRQVFFVFTFQLFS